jgi:hypothetical protein
MNEIQELNNVFNRNSYYYHVTDLNVPYEAIAAVVEGDVLCKMVNGKKILCTFHPIQNIDQCPFLTQIVG